MQVPFKHPLATHHAMEVLGYRRNGSPIYAIAGGNGEGAGGSGSGASSGGEGGQGGSGDGGAAGGNDGQGSGQQGADGGQGSTGSGSEPDWKALARQWEKRAKDNKDAVDELAALKASQMSDQEKAVADAEKRGRTVAAIEHGKELAAARFEAAASKAGVDLGEAAELIDTARFVDKDGKVDSDGITAAVKKLAKLAPKGAGRSGGDMGGGGGSGDQAASIDKQIEDATKARNFPEVFRLKRLKSAQTT
ncbi:hypothetical protein [Streptomyces cylindrosporus]|uniref:Uncharacterized protein n=1 Tax=Streptomyces cylindrosporus TaxID=2927583 RepID=A0ABS9Y2G4_9ACTN|nr:hypothetical protein [Streptomyces cylindrosporus]MCI3271400.1 hypothetical protein [Streptomyces cylindrosporus]